MKYLRTIFPYLLMAIIVLGLIATVLVNRIDLTVRALGIGVPGFLAAVFILWKRNAWLTNRRVFLLVRNISAGNTFLVFIIVFILSLIPLLANSYRPWYYFLLIAALGLIIFLQILSERRIVPLLIFEMVLISLSLSLGNTLKYPLSFAGTDYLGHIFFSQITFLSGHIIPGDLNAGYNLFPLYHVIVAECAEIFGISVQSSLFLVTGIIFSGGTIFVYLLIHRLTKNERLSLMTCLFYIFNWTVVVYDSYVVTRALAFIWFIFLLYLITTFKRENRVISEILAILTIIFILLVHLPSFPHFLIVMLFLYVLERLVGSEKYISSQFLSIFVVLYLSYCIYISATYTSSVLVPLLTPSELTSAPLIRQNVQSGNESNFLLTNLDIFVYLFFSLIGIGFLLLKGRRKYIVVLALFTLVMFLFAIPNPVQLVWQVTNLFRFDRLILIVTPFLALAIAAGIMVIWKYHSQLKTSSFIVPAVLTLSVGFYFIASLSLHGASDSQDFSWKQPRQYFSASEITGFEYVDQSIPYGSYLYSDYYASRFFQSKTSVSVELGLPYFSSSIIPGPGALSKRPQKDYVVFRQAESETEGLFFGSTDDLTLSGPGEYAANIFRDKAVNYDRIFSNRSLEIYY